MREEVFALTYFTEGGMNYGDVMGMDGDEREWFLRRLHSQKKREAAEIKKSQKSKGKK